MANIDTSYKITDSYGLPLFETLDTYIQSTLMSGAEPAMQTSRQFLAGDSLNLPQFTVVGISGGKIVRATWNATEASAIKPIGILAHGFVSGASNTTIFANVWVAGCFNSGDDSPLVWDATYDTTAKKEAYNDPKSNLLFRRRLVA